MASAPCDLPRTHNSPTFGQILDTFSVCWREGVVYTSRGLNPGPVANGWGGGGHPTVAEGADGRAGASARSRCVEPACGAGAWSRPTQVATPTYYTGHRALLTSYDKRVEPLYQVLPQSRHRSQKDEIVNISIDKAIREHASSLGPRGFPLRSQQPLVLGEVKGVQAQLGPRDARFKV